MQLANDGYLYSKYLAGSDRILRKNAFKRMNGKFGEFINFVASNYINDVKEDSETLFAKAKRIPTGGLQGLIYQKMLYMQSKNINVIENNMIFLLIFCICLMQDILV